MSYHYDDPAFQSHRLFSLKFYAYNNRRNQWKHCKRHTEKRPLHHDVSIITWNVDFMNRRVEDRMNGVIDHLRRVVLKGRTLKPCVILLQEVHHNALGVLLAHPWIRKHFFITPIDEQKWPHSATYGNVTLIERSITIHEASILFYEPTTAMFRTALVTDIKLAPLQPELYEGRRDLIIRIINTHLESTMEARSPEYRAAQLAICVELLKMEVPAAYGGIIGGDFNAIDENSAEQVRAHGLVDPCESSELSDPTKSHTWGFHEKRPSQFPTCRMDKIVFTPRGDIMVESPEVFGQDAKTEDDEWVSDHYGLLTTLSV
ncbi:Endonuclease/exonuclease/phosphatase [Lentinula raphanica]|nr:Endonuclease/exonuclease/phosphatase [Lentinula raphanica]